MDGQVKKLNDIVHRGEPVDLTPFMVYLAIQGISHTAFGKLVGDDKVYELYENYEKVLVKSMMSSYKFLSLSCIMGILIACVFIGWIITFGNFLFLFWPALASTAVYLNMIFVQFRLWAVITSHCLMWI